MFYGNCNESGGTLVCFHGREEVGSWLSFSFQQRALCACEGVRGMGKGGRLHSFM